MSLFGALNIGGSALAVNQASLQVTGNNIANAGNTDYNRQVSTTTSTPDQQIRGGIYVGTGVDLSSIQRQVDVALQSRLNGSISDNEGANVTANWSGQIESVFNALGANSLDTQLSSFFNSWSNLANNPQNASLRQVVVQNGDSLAKQFNSLNTSFSNIESSIGTQLGGLVTSANQLSQQVADLNQQIALSQGGNNSLQDQRDAAVKKLSALVDVKSVQQGNGTVNLYIGSEPLVVGTVSRGLTLQQQSNGSQLSYGLTFTADHGTVPTSTGQLGALIGSQSQVMQVSSQLDSLAKGLIFGLNSVHASGQGVAGFTKVTSTEQVLDPTVPLNDPHTGLTYAPNNGSFVVHVKDLTTGLSSSTLVQVNLTGQPGDTTLNSLASSLSAIPNVQASISGGKLSIAAGGNTQISFSQDTSKTLASLGINTFYQGSNAQNIAVNSLIVSHPGFIAAAKNGDAGDNQTALSIAQVGGAGQAALGGASLNSAYRNLIGNVATTSSSAKNDAQATLDIRNTLESQRDALSGVSLDEEAINLVKQQQAFQGAARLVSAIDEMMKTLLAIT